MPDGVIERNAMMSARANRAVLACLDRNAEALAAAVERAASWDDYPRAFPYPAQLPRFRMAVHLALDYAVTRLRAGAGEAGARWGSRN